MSTHAIPSPTGDAQDSIRWQRAMELQRLAVAYIGHEPTITDDGTTLSLVFTPDLTAPQSTLLGRLVRITGLLRVTPAEWAAIESDISAMAAFLGVASPTLAQNSAATKAIIRVLRALMRD